MNIEITSPSLYFFSSVVLYLVVLFEMFYVWFVSKEKLRQFDLPLISTYTKLKQFLHHFLLPTIFYIALSGFIYYNNQPAIRIPFVLLSFIAFTSLFINLRAFYQDKFKLEESTYYVYDLIELVSFFMIVNLALHFWDINGLIFLIPILLVFVISLLIFILNLYQLDQLELKSLILVIIFSILVAGFLAGLVLFASLNLISLNLLTFISYYFLYGILSHKVDGSLNLSVMVEYLSIFLLLLAFFFGIS